MFRAPPIFRSFKCTLQTIGVCTSFDVLLHWIGYWLGHPHTFVTVRFRHIKTSTHTYGLQSTFEAPEDGRSPKHVEPTNK